ncbi:MAG: hypothetical protein IT393_09810 [Nitrospirae bacterium]|nr:hypothetical protein [Nitrospirota bacterium]
MAIIDVKKREELLTAINDGIVSTCEIIGQISGRLIDCANFLRMEQNEKVFNEITALMDNLSDLMDFIRELKNGLGQFEISPESLSSWDKSVDIFKEMLPVFEGKDWITLADLIEYELNPLLLEGKNGLSELKQRLVVKQVDMTVSGQRC